jgi:plasmid stability protein
MLTMGQLLVRDLDDEVIARLKKRAAAHGRSTEAEHRAILEEAVKRPLEPPYVVARRFLDEIADGGPDSAEMIREQRDARAERGSGE